MPSRVSLPQENAGRHPISSRDTNNVVNAVAANFAEDGEREREREVEGERGGEGVRAAGEASLRDLALDFAAFFKCSLRFDCGIADLVGKTKEVDNSNIVLGSMHITIDRAGEISGYMHS